MRGGRSGHPRPSVLLAARLARLEDRDAGVDANLVMLEPDRFVEVQGTGENGAFSRAELDVLLGYGQVGITRLFAAQREALGW